MERILQSFDGVSNWQDVSAFVSKLNKQLLSTQGEFPSQYTLIITKRLAQCMLQALPPGVHLKTIQCLQTLLSLHTSTSETADYLYVYSIALFPFIAHANSQLRSTTISVYDNLAQAVILRKASSALIMALLNVLDDSTLDSYHSSLKLLQKIQTLIGTEEFYHVIWTLLISCPKIRAQILEFLLKTLGKSSLEDIQEIITVSKQSAFRALGAALDDKDGLIQRNSLELLGLHFHFDGKTLDSLTKETLYMSLLLISLKKDMSLTRRIETLLCGSDRNAEMKTELAECLSESFKSYIQRPDCLLRGIKALRLWVDRPEIGNVIYEKVVLDILFADMNNRSTEEETKEALQMLINSYKSFYIWKQLFLLLKRLSNDWIEPWCRLVNHALVLVPLNDSSSLLLLCLKICTLLQKMTKLPQLAAPLLELLMIIAQRVNLSSHLSVKKVVVGEIDLEQYFANPDDVELSNLDIQQSINEAIFKSIHLLIDAKLANDSADYLLPLWIKAAFLFMPGFIPDNNLADMIQSATNLLKQSNDLSFKIQISEFMVRYSALRTFLSEAPDLSQNILSLLWQSLGSCNFEEREKIVILMFRMNEGISSIEVGSMIVHEMSKPNKRQSLTIFGLFWSQVELLWNTRDISKYLLVRECSQPIFQLLGDYVSEDFVAKTLALSWFQQNVFQFGIILRIFARSLRLFMKDIQLKKTLHKIKSVEMTILRHQVPIEVDLLNQLLKYFLSLKELTNIHHWLSSPGLDPNQSYRQEFFGLFTKLLLPELDKERFSNSSFEKLQHLSSQCLQCLLDTTDPLEDMVGHLVDILLMKIYLLIHEGRLDLQYWYLPLLQFLLFKSPSILSSLISVDTNDHGKPKPSLFIQTILSAISKKSNRPCLALWCQFLERILSALWLSPSAFLVCQHALLEQSEALLTRKGDKAIALNNADLYGSLAQLLRLLQTSLQFLLEKLESKPVSERPEKPDDSMASYVTRIFTTESTDTGNTVVTPWKTLVASNLTKFLNIIFNVQELSDQLFGSSKMSLLPKSTISDCLTVYFRLFPQQTLTVAIGLYIRRIDSLQTAVISCLSFLNPKSIVFATLSVLKGKLFATEILDSDYVALDDSIKINTWLDILAHSIHLCNDEELDICLSEVYSFLKEIALVPPPPFKPFYVPLFKFFTTFIRRVNHLKTQPKLRVDLQDLYVKMCENSVSLLIKTKLTTEEDKVEASFQPIASELVELWLFLIYPEPKGLLDNQDKMGLLMTSFATQVIPMVIKTKPSHRMYELALKVAAHPHILNQKVLKKELWDFFMDPKFFELPLFLEWGDILMSILKLEKDKLLEILNRIPSSIARGRDLILKIQSIKRIGILLLCGEQDQFFSQLPAIQEKIVDLFKYPQTEVLVEVFLCLRILFSRISAIHLVNIWPIILTELIKLLKPPGLLKEDLSVILAALKLVDTILTLQIEDFHWHRWIFIPDHWFSDTNLHIDPPYRPFFHESAHQALLKSSSDIEAVFKSMGSYHYLHMYCVHETDIKSVEQGLLVELCPLFSITQQTENINPILAPWTL